MPLKNHFANIANKIMCHQCNLFTEKEGVLLYTQVYILQHLQSQSETTVPFYTLIQKEIIKSGMMSDDAIFLHRMIFQTCHSCRWKILEKAVSQAQGIIRRLFVLWLFMETRGKI